METLAMSERVARKIERGESGRLWTYSDFSPLPETAVAAALSRLVKRGLLLRVRKGVYYKPKKSRFGPTTPDAASVAAAVLKRRGIRAVSTGLPAYNALGLTTQVSPVLTFAVGRRIGSLRTGVPGRIRLRSVVAVRSLKPAERAVLDALRDLKSIPDAPPKESIRRIAELFRNHRLSFERVAIASLREPPRVRALVGTMGTILGENHALLQRLRSTLNKTTTFKLGLSPHFPEARAWGIR